MNQELVKAAIQFLMRAQLTGEEVPTFNAVMRALHDQLHDKKDEDKALEY